MLVWPGKDVALSFSKSLTILYPDLYILPPDSESKALTKSGPCFNPTVLIRLARRRGPSGVISDNNSSSLIRTWNKALYGFGHECQSSKAQV